MAGELNRFNNWMESIHDLRIKLLWCRAILGESLAQFDPDTEGVSFLLDAMAWRRYVALLPPMEQRDLKRHISTIGIQALVALETLETITKQLAWLDETTYLAVETLPKLHPHAIYIEEMFSDSEQGP